MKNRLDKELPRRGLTRSRNDAQEKIRSGKVSVNGKNITKIHHPVDDADTINLEKTKDDFVGRGGKKLEAAAEKWSIDFKNKIVIDVGSSTGGFTEAALSHGAKKVYAVDVGTNQLDEKLRNNDRVIIMEQTDIRSALIPEKCKIALVDVSFISLTKILDAVQDKIFPEGIIIALIKPQFEVGKIIAAKYKGVIKSDAERQNAVANVVTYARSIGLEVTDTMVSPITGTDGNIEYLAYMKKRSR